MVRLVNSVESMEDFENKIKNLLPILLRGTIIILIISLVSLFLTGYNNYLDYLLDGCGILIIILSIKYLLLIKKIILEITSFK